MKSGLNEALFYTKLGAPLPSVSPSVHHGLRDKLLNHFSISQDQTIEAASYSMAMVVRYALGLSAQDGISLGVISDNEAGCIVAATLRHLENGGARTQVFILGEIGQSLDSLSPLLMKHLNPLIAMGVPVGFLIKHLPPHDFRLQLEQSHNVLCALADEDSSRIRFLIDALNDSPTPSHSVTGPPGVNLETGLPTAHPLFSSSTLSLGLPLSGLHKGNEFVGRHYVCDISLPQKLLKENDINCPILFSEQPVQQIFTEDPTAQKEEREEA